MSSEVVVVRNGDGDDMSSGVAAGGAAGGALIAAAVVMPAAVIAGTGWAAFEAGKFLINVGIAMNDAAEEKRLEILEKANQRKKLALENHKNLTEVCTKLMAELDGRIKTAGGPERESLVVLKAEIKAIVDAPVPSDSESIEGTNVAGFAKLDRIVAKQKKLMEVCITMDSDSTKHTVADLIASFKVAIMSAAISETRGMDVVAADPEIIERAELNDRFLTVVGRLMHALEHVGKLSMKYGFTEPMRNWMHMCFDGKDKQIMHLSSPTTNNTELKKGILSLEDAMKYYDKTIVAINKECMELHAMYEMYVEVCKALDEPIKAKSEFKNADELQAALEYLRKRNEKAKKCAEIYKRLGKNAYICYAWDQELQKLGYSIHDRRTIIEKAELIPEYAKLGEKEMPFYMWKEEELTQLYSVADECDLQVIVHEDGTVTMKAIADGDKERAAATTEKSICSKMAELISNLKKNWFLSYDYHEEAAAEDIVTFEEWRDAEDNVWNNQEQNAEGRNNTDGRREIKNDRVKKKK